MANRLLMYWGECVFFYCLAHLWLIHPVLNKCSAELPGPTCLLCLQVHKNASVSVCFSFYSHTFTDECQRRCAHPIVVINLHTATVYSQSVSAIQSLSRVSIALWKEPQSDTAISHSMALPNPISSHVDCIRIGGPGAQREARGYLSYLWPERWFRKSTWSGWAGLLRLPCGEQRPLLKNSSLSLKQSLLSVLASDCLWVALPKSIHVTQTVWFALHLFASHHSDM